MKHTSICHLFLYALLFMATYFLDTFCAQAQVPAIIPQSILEEKVLPLIAANTPKLTSKNDVSSPTAPSRSVFEVVLSTQQVGGISLIINMPKEAMFSGKVLPAIFIASGFQTAKALSTIVGDDIGDNVLVFYEYSLDDKADWINWSNPTDQQNFLDLFTKTPLQIASSLLWMRGSELSTNFGFRIDSKRMNTLAISLGGFFLPCGQRLAQNLGITISGTVFAFTGADLKSMVGFYAEQHPGDLLVSLARPLFEGIVAPFEPGLFVSELKSEFLILSAEEDQVFPKKSTEALIGVTPNPKEIVLIPGNHIGLGQRERVMETFGTVKAWLLEKQKINP